MTPTPNSDGGGHEEAVEANARLRIPVTPLGGGGEGDFYPDHGGGRNGVLGDVTLVARALGDSARYPIPAEKRQKLIDWLWQVIEKSEDDRVRSKCAATLLAADKLNLEVARLMIEEERLRIAKPPVVTGGGGVTVIIETPVASAKV